jgi:kynurenine formamidase
MFTNRKIIDLSVPIMNGIISDPEQQLPEILYTNHREGAKQIASLFPGMKDDDLPSGEGWAVEDLKVTSHSGTHIDAPYHYHDVDENGNAMMTIDEVPLSWFYGRGVKLDFSNYEDGHVVTVNEVKKELKRINHVLCSGDIVLIHTSAGEKYGKDNFLNSGCGIGREATIYLTEHGVHLVGTDAWSWDAPFSYTIKNYIKDGDVSKVWEGHFAGIKHQYCQMEKLGNLYKLPSKGFSVIAFPVNIYKASAGWARPVAILD